MTLILALLLTATPLESRTEALSEQIRCPVCQGSSIADSPSLMATQMREKVRELLERGLDEEEIIQHFERSYGEEIRLQPKVGSNRLLFTIPVLGLVVGVFAVWRLLRKGERS